MSSTASAMNIVLPVTLEGSVVRLEPLRREHAELFWNVAKDDLEDIFRWIPYSMKSPEDFQRLVDKAFTEQQRGESVVFATVERKSGRAIGSTRFMNIDRGNRRVEIGSTWIAPAWQRTAGEHGSKISDAAACLRSVAVFSRGIEDGCAQRKIPQCNSAHRCERRRHAATARAHVDRPRSRQRVFQHSR